jgi:hypothetical protein
MKLLTSKYVKKIRHVEHYELKYLPFIENLVLKLYTTTFA